MEGEINLDLEEKAKPILEKMRLCKDYNIYRKLADELLGLVESPTTVKDNKGEPERDAERLNDLISKENAKV
jgi:hypothetical protein